MRVLPPCLNVLAAGAVSLAAAVPALALRPAECAAQRQDHVEHVEDTVTGEVGLGQIAQTALGELLERDGKRRAVAHRPARR